MGAYFQAEKLKNRHTFLWGLTILMPLVCSLLSAQLTHRYFAMDGYNWWYMMMMPGFLTIICGLVGGKDLKKQNRTIGSLPADTGKIWDAKVLLCAVASGMATFALTVFVFFGTLLLKDGLHMVFINPPSFGNQILAAVLIWITSLWQLPFCLFLTQKTGVLPAAVLNLAAGQIVGPLASLKAWFFLIPYGITPRVMCPVIKTLPNGLVAGPGQLTYADALMDPFMAGAGAAVSLLWFVLIWYLGRKWYRKKVELG